MGKVWAFISEPKNLAVIVALAGGVGFVVKEVVLPNVHPKQAVSAPVEQKAVVTGGGTAVNAAGEAQVNVGESQASAVEQKSPQSPGAGASQSAESQQGGVAVNAAGSAKVHVQQVGASR